ncbi:hypothetical protein F5146DRAFT_1006950 [Armillaria mellea]|nr:hypothetical protein F5146DRAFT_1006950 [Armillaria mellea]
MWLCLLRSLNPHIAFCTLLSPCFQQLFVLFPTSTMQDFTPKNIKLHSKLLLHKKNPDEKITAFNSALGGLYNSFIVTMPNTHTLYAPPLGNNHIMYLHSDLRYGDNDPLSWPQPYIPQYCHFPIIHSVLLNPSESHPDAPLHWLPGKTDFYEADSAGECKGPGFLLHQKFVWLQNQYLLMSLEKVQLSVQETQHVTLYLKALIDYMLIYKPCMDAIPDGSMPQKADHELMGVYMSDPQVAQSFLCAGIPVWIIWPVEQLPNIHIDKVDHFQDPHFFISLDQHRAKFHPIFKGHGLSAKNWKTLVSLDYFGKASQQENSDTKAAKHQDRMREFLKECADEIKMDVGTIEKDIVFWRRKPYSELITTDFQEIVWEISELEFHLELAELDCMVQVAVPNHDTAGETAVLCCFAGPITIANVRSANMGLALMSLQALCAHKFADL